MNPRRRWWREPALHFVLLGAGVFALDAWRRPRVSARDITVSASYVRGLREDYQRRHGRTLTRDELRAEVDRFVREEVLYREALTLGLERGDLIVRRRLVQKMEFVLEDVAPPRTPTDAELEGYLRAHTERYARPARLSLRHVFFDRGRRGEHLAVDARNSLEALRSGSDPAMQGDPFVSATTFTDAPIARIAGDLSDGFAERIAQLDTGTWQGPVESPYGLHLVIVSSRVAGALPTLDEVRERVSSDWRDSERERSNREAFRRVSEGYHIRVEGL